VTWAEIYWQGFVACAGLRVLIYVIGWKHAYRELFENRDAWPIAGLSMFVWPLFAPFQIIELAAVIGEHLKSDD
jgi:hypothetical protein